MATSTSNKQGATAEPVRRFLETISRQDRMLLVLRQKLYAGDWRPMVTDLRHRMEGRPYVFRLSERIEDDLQRIQRMSDLEQRHDVHLGELIDLDDSPQPEARA